MLTNRVLRNGAGYAHSHLERNDYYAEGEKVQGQWFGIGAQKLGLEGPVQLEQFERVRQGLHPETGEKLRQRLSLLHSKGERDNHARNLYDLTLSAPKSVSMMAILTGDKRLIEAHDRAVAQTLIEIEKQAATRVRANDQNEDRVTGNLVVACYRHDSSRRLDPQLHTHCAAANMTFDETEQKWKVLQAGGIYRRTTFFTEVYRNILAQEIEALGYKTENRKNGFEIAGVPQFLIDLYSQGSKEREAAVAAFIEKYGVEPTNNEIAVLVRDTRPDKLIHISTAEVRRQQLDRLTARDWNMLTQVREEADLNRKTPAKSIDAETALQQGLDHVFERVSVAPDYVVLAAALKFGRGQVQLGDLTRAMSERQGRDEIIRHGDDVATHASLEREKEMIETVRKGRNKHERMGKEPKEFNRGDLDPQQNRVVDFVLDSRDFAVNIEGAAGEGKTKTLRGLARGLQASGRLMVATAPTESAVKALKKVGFQNAQTIEALLQNKDAHPLLSGRAIVVDEAGMVSGRQMIELIRLAQRFDARIILAGDTKQLQSVEACDSLRILVKEKAVASKGLLKVHRQEVKEYKDAIRALRYNTEKGFYRLEKMGAVEEADMFDRPEKVAKAYREAKGSVLVVCPTHEEIRRVTHAIRADLIRDNKLGPETKLNRLEPLNWTEAEKRDVRNFQPGQVLVFHKGTKDAHKYEAFTVTAQEGQLIHARSEQGRDVVLTKKQAKCFGVFARHDIAVAAGDWLSIQSNLRDDAYQFTNGERVKVASINEQGGIVLEDKRTIPHNFKQFTHGYAVTAHKSQGQTVDEVIISGDGMKRELFYVAASRGRKRISIFTGDIDRLRESIGISGERMSALDLMRRNARTVDRTRQAEPEEQPARDVMELVGRFMQKVWDNVPRILFGPAFAPSRDRGLERGR